MHANEPGLPLPGPPPTTPARQARHAGPQGARRRGRGLGGRRLAALPPGDPHVDRLPGRALPRPPGARHGAVGRDGASGNLVSPILMGGIALGCRSLETGGDLELEHLLAGFRRNTGILLRDRRALRAGEDRGHRRRSACSRGRRFVWAALRGDEGARSSSRCPRIPCASSWARSWWRSLAVPLMAAYWFAPALAMLHDMPAIPAMKASFVACLRNFMPMTVYGLLMLALADGGGHPAGAGPPRLDAAADRDDLHVVPVGVHRAGRGKRPRGSAPAR